MTRTRLRVIEAAALVIPIAIFLLRVVLEIQSGRRKDYDEYIFLDVAHQILTSGLPIRTYDFPSPAFFFDHTPLYVYALAAVTAVGGDTLLIGRAISVLFGLGTVTLAFFVARRVHGPASGFVAATLIAVNPFFAELSWFVRMEVPLCFFLVLALWAIDRDRVLLAGLAIAAAVMLKEIALAFWLVGAVYVLARHGRRAALTLAAPAPLALGAWFAYAVWLDSGSFGRTMLRWLNSTGGDVPDPRMQVSWQVWARKIIQDIVNWSLLVAAGATAPLFAMWRRRVPAIAWVPIAYVLVAMATSFLIRLKEPRYLIAVIPMAALAIALAVDWDRFVAEVRSPRP